MASIKSSAAFAFADCPGAHLFMKPGCLIEYCASRTDVCGDSAISHAQQVPVVLNCTKDSIRQVLAHDRRWSQISIVRNINQHVCAFVSEAPRDRRMRGFYTNK